MEAVKREYVPIGRSRSVKKFENLELSLAYIITIEVDNKNDRSIGGIDDTLR